MTLDPADELRAAQVRHRRRMLLVLGAAAFAAAAFVLALVLFTGGRARLLPAVSRPFLFEVSGGGAPQPSYLFGTIHVGYGVDDLPAAVRAAQDRAATTVLESDLESREEAPPPDTRGRARLDDDEWAKLAKHTGLSEAELEHERTSHLLGASMSSLLPRVEAMDRGFQRRAREQQKPLVFLETRMLEDVMNEGTLLDGLRATLEHRGAFRAELLKLARRYAAGDERACAGSLTDVTSGLNDAWAAAIEAQVLRGNAFIAIGCGHLAGDDSIVKRLQARGFSVTRVK